jgi:hypothetical protein
VHPFATGAFKNALADHGFRRSAMRLNTQFTIPSWPGFVPAIHVFGSK